MKEKLNINLQLTGEASFFVQLVQMQSGMPPEELFSKMIALYKQVYFSDKELAWIKGDTIVQKLNSEELKRNSNG